MESFKQTEECPVNQPAFTLWHRRRRGHPWRAVASAATEGELTDHYGKVPSGECVTLPNGRHPDDRRKVRA